MANTVKARIQLKCDTEENWNKAIHFIPLKGEIIIYSADDSHPFCRLKVGDGSTNVVNLPFIDAGTIDGKAMGHTLIFGNGTYTFDGSQDVTVPVYTGAYV